MVFNVEARLAARCYFDPPAIGHLRATALIFVQPHGVSDQMGAGLESFNLVVAVRAGEAVWTVFNIGHRDVAGGAGFAVARDVSGQDAFPFEGTRIGFVCSLWTST